MTDKEMTDKEMAEKLIKGWYSILYPMMYPIAIVKDFIRKSFFAGLEAGRPKWHMVADGDLPKESISVLILSSDGSLDECIYIPCEGFKDSVFSTWYQPVAWIEKEKILPKM